MSARASSERARVRAADLGIDRDAARGPCNAITDVAGVRVGSVTLVEGDGPLVPGRGPVRTGVTAIVPHDGEVWSQPLFAGVHRMNGNGELTGAHWIEDGGRLASVIGLTSTGSVGLVRDALAALAEQRPGGEGSWALPVVGETWDGLLNDVAGQHVRAEHVRAAVARASDGPVAEGAVGAGTGTLCHGFKGGIGTASRVVATAAGAFTVGVLLQTNHGRRDALRVAGVPVGRVLGGDRVPLPRPPERPGLRGGSVIGVVATDAPLLPHQCRLLAHRASFGIVRSGGLGEHWSGDFFLCFSTANRAPAGADPSVAHVAAIGERILDRLFAGAADATEEAVLNALLAAETTVGRDGITAHALGAEELLAALHEAAWKAPDA